MSFNTKYQFAQSVTTFGTRNDLVLANTGNGVSIPFDNSLKIGTGSFVVGVWYKPSSLPSGSNIVIEYGTTYPNGYLFNLFAGGVLLVYFVSGPPTFSVSGIVAGTWYRIVLVGNAGTGIVELWVNGVSKGTASYGSWNVTANDPTAIGAYPEVPVAAPGEFSDFILCKGSVSGFTIPDSTAISNDYARIKDFTGISARFPLDEGKGSTIHPSVGSASNGTLTGGSWSTFPIEYSVHLTDMALTPPGTITLVKMRMRWVGKSVLDGYAIAAAAEWQAVGGSGGVGLLSTITSYFAQYDAALTDSRANIMVDGYAITPIVGGVFSIDIDWTVWIEYWVQ